MVEFCSLFSGSSGNCSFVRVNSANILVDCGGSGAQICSALEEIGVDPTSLDGIIITHEHIDHIKGAGVLSRRYDLPVYASHGTWEGMVSRIGGIFTDHVHYIQGSVPFAIKDAVVSPFRTPHDVKESVGYTISDGVKSVSVATDLGIINKTVYNAIKDSQIVLLESNHDLQMLMNGSYSADLKRRIKSSTGHLSNDDCAVCCTHLLDNGTKHLILGHLSSDNNTPEKAYSSSVNALTKKGAKVGSDVTLEVAPRYCVSKLYRE